MSWTDQRIETLKTLWANGHSASQIAGRLGHVTRNAVIGKVHRLGLSGRATTTRARTHKPSPSLRSSQPRVRKPTRTPFEPAIRHLAELPPLAPAPDHHPTVTGLQPGDCRWPIGDPKQPGFHFCGRPNDLFHSYCSHHFAVATKPHVERRKAKTATAPISACIEAAAAAATSPTA